MANTVFRSSAPMVEAPVGKLPDPKPNELGGEENLGDIEPVEDHQSAEIILSALGVDDSERNLPEEDRENLHEVKKYLLDILKARQVSPTVGAYQRVLNEIKTNLEIDPDTEPGAILERIGGIVKGWKSLSFISDLKERRGILMKLSRASDTKEMDRIIYWEMTNKKVWR